MTTKTINDVCRETIAKTLTIFHGVGSTIELRALGVGGNSSRTDSGYFNNMQRATNAAAELSKKMPYGIYFCLNSIPTALIARAQNRIQEFAKKTTSDSDVLWRKWLYIDFDPKRPSDISTTEEEHAAGLLRANDVSDWLKEQGFPDPILADSGNGTHLHYPIDLPNDADSTAIVKAVTAEIASRYSDNKVLVDAAVFNPARICRLYGTWARKGDDTEERPHRRSALIDVPELLENGWNQTSAATADLLKKIGPSKSQSAPKSSVKTPRFLQQDSTPLDLRELLTNHGIDYREGKASAEYPVMLHVQCPFNESHMSKDAYVAQHQSGALVFHCSHNSCAHNKWHEFKAETGIVMQRQPSTTKVVGAGSSKTTKKRVIVDSTDGFKPFPVEELPEPLNRFCSEIAASVGCDSSFPALVVLSVCSAAVGTTRQLEVKLGWNVPCVIWTALVGESGTQKSPPFHLATNPVKVRQNRELREFIAANDVYTSEMKFYRKSLSQWQRDPVGIEPQPPAKPRKGRCLVQDTTIEAMAPILKDNPRGLLLARDELSGWIASFDKYSSKSSASSDVSKWLETYGCGSIAVDRKTGDEKCIVVDRAFVSIAGAIQPGILSKVLTAEHKENGLQSRFLMTYPPRRPKKWREEEVSTETQVAYSKLVRELFALKHDGADDDPVPATLRLNTEAKRLFTEYVDRHAEEQNAMSGHMASQWSKLEEIPARLSIILHCVRQVTPGVEDYWHIDETTMQSAVVLTEWFKNETLRIGRLLAKPELDRRNQFLAGWIRSRGGSITARDLSKARRDIANSEDAELQLIALVDAGYGSWRDIQRSREFVLHDSSVSADADQVVEINPPTPTE
jgi:hypothetical protein